MNRAWTCHAIFKFGGGSNLKTNVLFIHKFKHSIALDQDQLSYNGGYYSCIKIHAIDASSLVDCLQGNILEQL